MYAKYVELKTFTGSSAPDPTISTREDLERLIGEVKKLTNFTEGAMPVDRQDSGNGSTQEKGEPKDWTDNWKNFVPPEPVSRLTVEFIELIINELNKAGKKDRLRWDQFDGRPLPRPQDRIIAQVEYNVAGVGKVEIALKRRPGQRHRQIEFQQFDTGIGPNPIFRAAVSNNSNAPVLQYPPDGPRNDGRPIVLDTSQLSGGCIEFDSAEGAPSEITLGRYLLFDLGEVLKDGTRVTFDWIEG